MLLFLEILLRIYITTARFSIRFSLQPYQNEPFPISQSEDTGQKEKERSKRKTKKPQKERFRAA